MNEMTMKVNSRFYILKKTYTHFFTIGVSLFFLFSCAKSQNEQSSMEEGPTNEEIHKIYTHYIKGHYSEYVSHIASCQGKPRFYKEQLINLYKQQLAEQLKMHGNIDSIKIERVHKSSTNQYAKVYIRHFYDKSSSEEVLLQMVYTEKGWKIK